MIDLKKVKTGILLYELLERGGRIECDVEIEKDISRFYKAVLILDGIHDERITKDFTEK